MFVRPSRRYAMPDCLFFHSSFDCARAAADAAVARNARRCMGNIVAGRLKLNHGQVGDTGEVAAVAGANRVTEFDRRCRDDQVPEGEIDAAGRLLSTDAGNDLTGKGGDRPDGHMILEVVDEYSALVAQ